MTTTFQVVAPGSGFGHRVTIPVHRYLEARFEEPSAVGRPLLPTTHRQDCEELRQNAIQLICGARDHQNCKQDSRYSPQAAIPTEDKHATVLATVQGEAASRRPFDRPGRLLRAEAATALVGMEEWCRATEPEHGVPAVRVLPQLAGRQTCQIQNDWLS